MPPFIPRKRPNSTPPPDTPDPKSVKKITIFETFDTSPAAGTLQDNKAFVDRLNGSDTETSLSDVSSAEFEDAFPSPSPKRRKLDHNVEDDEEIDWEDAIQAGAPAGILSAGPPGDLELTLDKGTRIGSFTNPHDKKKGPSKIERQIRISTHCIHVQFLLFHNAIRNSWACDKETQSILLGQLSPDARAAISNWKLKSGMGEELATAPTPPKSRAKGGKKSDRNVDNERNHRDWGKPAERQERGEPDMSSGDPVIKLLKALAKYWKKQFTITAPGLRKQGYKLLELLEADIASFKKGKHHPEEHGERIKGIKDFRNLAKSCEGSRDFGVQLFTALLRGLGLEARLVASLQPVGFGWSKNEEASSKQKRVSRAAEHTETGESISDDDSSIAVVKSNKASQSGRNPPNSTSPNVKRKSGSKVGRGQLIDLSGDSSNESEDENSVIDITPSKPRRKPNMNYDNDLHFPTYWVEVISPITNDVYPVDPFILTPAVATGVEQLAAFESRGPKADKARQVFAYIVAYSPDGTAKDVTTRYIKRHMWPGRTRGVRMPVQKVPVYNKKGKIKQYEEYDWFKTVMSGYMRSHKMRTVVDDLEEAKDLKPVKPEKKENKAGEETLQGYKTSADFVLERHLRREEALLPGSKPVKTFVAGKGDNAKEEPVFRRKDVVVCRTSESWHKEGREVKPGEQPIKMVPVRAVTLMRKREVEEAERHGGEKLKQGLYAWEQTDWIIPPPIENGVIPKNAFGNMDCYVPSMVPKGAVHVPLRSTVKICKRLGIDYAEAVTGFEFGKQRAVPVITGVVVAAENEDPVIDEWEKDEEERRIKEEGKREKVALGMWRKFLMGLRIVARVREEYGGDADAHMKEEMNPFTNKNKTRQPAEKPEPRASTNGNLVERHDEDMAGGFIVDDPSGGEGPDGFVPDGDEDGGGGFLPDGHDEGGNGFPPGTHDDAEPYPPDRTDLIITHEDDPIRQEPTADRSNTKHDLNNSASDLSDTATSPPPKNPQRGRPSRNANTAVSNLTAPNAKRATKNPRPPEPLPSPQNNAKPATRKSARASAKVVKSPYFARDKEAEDEEDDDEEDGESGESEESVYEKPPAKRGRGRPRKGIRG